MRILLGLVFLLGLIYLILPGPGQINNFSHLPISLKSQLAGDTIQNPNIAAYYSDYDRSYVTKFYQADLKKNYCDSNFFGLPNPICFIPPIRINHPPQEAFTYIRDQQESTYLEEYLYPLRESLYVNGFEPIDKTGKKFDNGSKAIETDNVIYFSKTTIRFYPTPIWARLLIYLGIWATLFGLWTIGRRVLKNG